MIIRIVKVVFLISLLLLFGCLNNSKPAVLRVGVAQYSNHPALDDVREGFFERMEELGFHKDNNIQYVYQNAQGDMNLTQNIASSFATAKYNLIFSIATPITQALKRVTAASGTPVIFGAITDPVSAGLVSSMDSTGTNLTGTSDVWPYYAQLALIKEILPNVDAVGILFNPGEDNTRFAMDQTRQAAQRLGIKLIESPISSSNDTSLAIKSIIDKANAFYVPADNMAMSVAPTIIKIAHESKKPVFAGDPGTFESGAVAGVGVSYRNLGRESANLAYQVLVGKRKPSELAVVTSKDPEIMVNLVVARRLGITIPESLISKAGKIVK